ncbi:MAG: glycosyltransferase family 4 protein [archaeon]|nr:glycosyltransferase family 4 protein [Candidatus Bathyarchaeum sp.]
MFCIDDLLGKCEIVKFATIHRATMPRVCLVTHFFPPHMGGIEKVSYEQSKRLTKAGYEFDVLTSKTKGQTRNPIKGINVYPYPSLKFADRFGVPYPILTVNAYKLFAKTIRNCDLVHAHGHVYMSSCLAGMLAKKYNKPFIVTQHNTYIDYKSWLNTAENLNDVIIGKSVLKRADRILTVSKETMKYVLSLGADKTKTSVMYNGVDTDCFQSANKSESRDKLGLPLNRKIVFSARRLVYKNGLDTLIESANVLAKNHPEVLFVVAGKGPSRSLIEERIKELGIEKNIKLAGFVPDELLPVYYGAADVFLLPSASGEGLPLVLFEAMSCGLPVVATTVGGTPEIVEHMQNGVLVPPQDPQVMADAISRLLAEKETMTEIGKQAKEYILSKLSWKENARQLLQVYQEFLQ